MIVLSALAVAWFLAVLILAGAGVFEAAPSQPPLALLVAVAGPPIVFGLAYRWSTLVRDFVLGVDPRMLVAIQAWRVIGIMFLALYAFGLLPGLFAWPAGVGDVAVGVAAVLVLRGMLHGAPSWRQQVIALNVAGLLDFLAAIGTGVLSSDPAFGFVPAAAHVSLGTLPLVLVPAFAVPLWILFHLMSLIQIARGIPGRSGALSSPGGRGR